MEQSALEANIIAGVTNRTIFSRWQVIQVLAKRDIAIMT